MQEKELLKWLKVILKNQNDIKITVLKALRKLERNLDFKLKKTRKNFKTNKYY